jgi:hypothetical protein
MTVRRHPRFLCPAPLLVLALSAFLSPAASAALQDPSPARVAEIEADWLRQIAPRSPMSTREDALGAVDGVKDGKWGFHCGLAENPWWQVDLGEVQALDHVLVYNRADGTEGRAARIMLLVSDDGQDWRKVYQNDGSVFRGFPDGKPLTVPLDGQQARFVRLQLPGTEFLHLDEVEVYGTADPARNLALWRDADEIATSQWSAWHPRPGAIVEHFPTDEAIRRGRLLADDLEKAGVPVAECRHELTQVAEASAAAVNAPAAERQALYFRARRAVRRLALANPLLDFGRLLFAKRVSSSYSHMSDQNYGWWSRPGGGLFALEGFREDQPREVALTPSLPPGSVNSPDLSYDGRRVLFAYCQYDPQSAGCPDKVNKLNLPAESFYHVYEMNVDGSGLRQLTFGRYDDFEPRYLPSGEIVFLTTRRGTFVQCSRATAESTRNATLPDSYVRCGGDLYRPVSVYTLHVMDADGQDMRPISPFENFEWNPSVANDGRVLFARWDYVDRNNMPYMKLWSTNPDGSDLRLVYGNFTTSFHCAFEARSIPHSSKLLMTASGHHAITAGSLVLLDPTRGLEGADPITRLTPEVCFPEVEGWPTSYYVNPYPLSETYYLTSWSNQSIMSQGGLAPDRGAGVYLYDAFGNLELLYRDPAINCGFPLPLRARTAPPAITPQTDWAGPQEARVMLLNVYEGLAGVTAGSIRSLRIVGVPAKVQPQPNYPNLGVTGDDPGKCVLGTVPVEADGSAYFRVPSGLPVFFQALDRDGIAVQTMRTATYMQPGQSVSCVGCHEARESAPATRRSMAAARVPSRLTPGPDGSWPHRYDRLVQPVLDRLCVRCHQPREDRGPAGGVDLQNAAVSYDALLGYGSPSLRDHVRARYYEGRSLVGQGAAAQSPLLALLRAEKPHHGVKLDADAQERLVTWLDTYGQRQGAFSDEQERALTDLRAQLGDLLVQ